MNTIQRISGLVLLTFCQGLHGQTLYWGGGNSSWATASNWYTDAGEGTASSATPTITDDLFFNTTPDNASGSAITVNTNVPYFARSMTFNTSGGTSVDQGNNARTLTLGAGGITLNSGSGNVSFNGTSSSLWLQSTTDQTWLNSSTSALTVRRLRASDTATGPVTVTLNAASTGNIAFALAVTDSLNGTKPLGLVIDSAGSGQVSIAGGTYTGGTHIKRGLLTTASSAGTGTVVIGNSGEASAARFNATGTVANNITVQAGHTGLQALSTTGSATFTGNIQLNNNLALGSAAGGTPLVTASGVISGTGNLTIGRVLAGSANPTVTLGSANTYTGKTIIESATVVVSSLGNLGVASSLGAPVSIANGTITMSGVSASTLRYTGSGDSTNRVIEMAGGSTLEQAGTGNLVFAGDVTQGGTLASRTLTLRGATAGTGEISGLISNVGGGFTLGLAKIDSGTWRLSNVANTYASTTTLTAGVLEVVKLADTGVASSIGTGSSNNISFGGGTLRYVGSGDSTNRVFIVGAAGGTFDASGTGAVSFTRTTAPTYPTANAAISLGLTGTNTGANTYAANQNNNGTGAVSVTKNGVGTWILTGTNTYTGATTVNDGTLLINGSLAAGSAVSVTGGTLGGTGSIGGTVSVAAGATLAPGASIESLNTGTVTLATDAVLALELNTGLNTADLLNITGNFALAGTNDSILTLSLLGTDTLKTLGTVYTLVDYSGSWNGGLFEYNGGTLADGGIFTLGLNAFEADYNALGGAFTLTTVPEPSSKVLLALSLGALWIAKRKRTCIR